MAEKLTKEQIEEQNRKATQLNSKRNQMIGQKQSAEDHLKRMAATYLQRYGVQLTPANLQEEYNEQSAAVHELYAEQAALIASVESGEYKKAAAPVLSTPAPVSLSAAGTVTGRTDASAPNLSGGSPEAQEAGLGLAVGAQGFTGVPSVPTGGDAELDPSEAPFSPEGWG